MADYKYKYLRVTRKDDKMLVRRINVDHLSKKGREARWDELDAEYPREEYVSCYETSQSVYDQKIAALEKEFSDL